MRVWTGRDILLALVGSFAVVLAVNVYYIVSAVNTYPGEDVRHPYLQGADFNETLRDRAQQSRLGWKVSIAAKREANGQVTVVLNLAQPDGRPVRGETLSGLLRHPMNEQLDQDFALQERGPGTYIGHISGVHSGIWDILANRSKAAEAPFTAERRVFLP